MRKMQARLSVNGKRRSYVRTKEQRERETKNIVSPVRIVKGEPCELHTVEQPSYILANYARLEKHRAQKQKLTGLTEA